VAERITVDPSQLDPPKRLTVDPGEVQPIAAAGQGTGISRFLPDPHTIGDTLTSYWRQVVDAATTPLPTAITNALPERLQPKARITGKDVVQPWTDLAQRGVQQLGEPFRPVPGAGYLLDALEGAIGKTGDVAGGAIDFGTSPLGLAALPLAGSANPIVSGATRSAFAGLMAPEAIESVKRAVKEPSGKNVGSAIASTAAAASPVAPELARVKGPDIGGAMERHNARAEQLVNEERTKGISSTEQGEHILGTKSMPVKIGDRTLEVQPAGESQTGRPFYRVVDPGSGKTVYGGYGEAVQGYLRVRGARPVGEDVARYPESQPTGKQTVVDQNAPSVRKMSARPEVPEEGPSDRVQRVGDARERLAQDLAGKPFKELSNSERLVVDHFVTEGYGFAVRRQEAGGGSQNADQRQSTESGSETEGGKQASAVSPEQVARVEPAVETGRGEPDRLAQPSERIDTAARHEVAKTLQNEPESTDNLKADSRVESREPSVKPAYGREVSVSVPGEQASYPARYAVREASDVIPSHNPQSFEANPNYEHQNDRDYSQAGNAARVVEYSAPGTFKPDYALTESPTAEHGAPVIDQRGNVLGGNNRTMTIQRVYARGGADAEAYRKQLSEKAGQLGIDPREIARFRNPVLVRELRTPVSSQEAQLAITNFNKTAAAQLSPAEQAITDGKRITPSIARTLAARIEHAGEDSTLSQALRGENGGEVLNELVNDGVFTRQEANGFVDERGHLTPEAKERIGNMIVGRMFSSPSEWQATPPDLRAKLERVAPHVLRVESREGWGITPQVREAVSAIAEARAHGIRNLDDLARQQSLPGQSSTGKSYSPEVLAIAKKLQEGQLAAQRAFRQYANDEALSREGAQTSMFEPPTREEAFQAAFGSGSAQFARDLSRPLPARGNFTRENVYSNADWEVLPARGESRPARLRLNSQARYAVSDAIGTGFGGVEMGPEQAGMVANAIMNHADRMRDNGQISDATWSKLMDLAHAFQEHGRGGLIGYVSDHNVSVGQAKVLREELTHWKQRKFGATQANERVAQAVASHRYYPLVRAALKRQGYGDDLRTHINELGAKLAAGETTSLGLTPRAAMDLLEHYYSQMIIQHGPGAAREILGYADRRVGRAIHGSRSARNAEVRWRTRHPGEADSGPAAFDRVPEGRAPATGERIREDVSGPRFARGSEPVSERERVAGTLVAVTLGLDKFVTEDVAPTLGEAARTVVEAADDILKILAPAARGRDAKTAALIMRNRLAELARRSDQAEASLAKAKKFFDRQKATDNYEFIHRMENGQAQKSADLDAIAKVFRTMMDTRRAEVQALGRGKLQQYYTNYFPHIWQNPKRAQSAFRNFFSRRPLEGGKSFLKQRTHITFADGLAAGLKPVSDNPVDLVILKAREMDRYIMAHQVLEDWKGSKLAKFVDARRGKAPVGWKKIDDPIGTVYGQSVQEIPEFPNERMYDALAKAAEALGISHKRGFKLGSDALGWARRGTGKIATRHGTAEDVLAHEIGHQLEWKYGLSNFLMNHPDLKTRVAIKRELRDLADLRNVPKAYRRNRDEKMAAIAQAWVGARDQFKRVAPTVYGEWVSFLGRHPELKVLRDVEGGMNAKAIAQPYDVGGLVIRGHWWAPEGAARIMNNYLTPGLRTKGAYRVLIGLNNVLNQFQLGLSAFHLGFTSADAAVSKAALGFECLMRGKPLAAAKAFASVPAAPLTTLVEGNKLLREWYKPGSQGGAIGKIVDGLVAAGGRAHMDEFYQTRIADAMKKAWLHGNWFGALLRSPFAGVEKLSDLIMREIVPRQKLGVFADLARFEMERLGPGATFEETRAALAKAWDSVENRMGQMTYDNLFWNRTSKDIAMLGMRSVGWNLGTLREIGGGGIDLVKEPLRMAAGTPARDVNTHRIAYLMGLVTVSAIMGALYQKLATGKGPEELKDYFFPKTGELDEAGRPQRAAMPTYVKDVYHYATEPKKTLAGKVAPIWSAFAEMIRNEDFYGNQIRNPDDPLVRQMADEAKYAVGEFTPFGARNIERDLKLGMSPVRAAQSEIGITPAPAALEKTRAERLAAELAQSSIPAGGRTREQAERREAEREIARRVRAGQAYADQARDYLQRGVMTSRDLHEALQWARLKPLAAELQHMSLADALKVWGVATPEERRELRGLLAKKARALKNEPPEVERTLAPKIQQALTEDAQR
jgi:hypothetical protein